MGFFISRQGLTNVKTYKYVGVDKSLIANYIMQPIWRWLVNFLPIWMAPNMVTLIGFVFIIISYLLTAYYHPHIIGVAPAWVYVLNGLFMFIYQTMDALDGKQARRTNTSSPLGELFDHGCDAVTTFLGVLTLGCTLHSGNGMLLLSIVLLMSAFYLTQWEEYYTGQLVLGYIGVTEAQIAAVFIYFLAAWEGPGFFEQTFAVAGFKITYGAIPVIVSGVSSFATIVSNFIEVWRHCNASGKDGKKITFLETFSGAISLFILTSTFVLWSYLSPTNLYAEHTHIFVLTYGFLVANLVGRIVIARVCHEPFPDTKVLLFPLILVPAAILSRGALFREEYFLVLYFVFGVAAYLHFALNIIKDLCRALKIRCFHISQRS